jgi:hypothetical protein
MATKFDGAFIEQRMADHRRWQHEVEYALIEEIIDEVQQLPMRKPKSGRLFEPQMADELRNLRLIV